MATVHLTTMMILLEKRNILQMTLSISVCFFFFRFLSSTATCGGGGGGDITIVYVPCQVSNSDMAFLLCLRCGAAAWM